VTISVDKNRGYVLYSAIYEHIVGSRRHHKVNARYISNYTMEGNNNDADGVLSPEMKSIIKRLEEEMDNAEKDFNKETELDDDNQRQNEALDESIFSEERQGRDAELDIQQMILVADQTTAENNVRPPPTLTPRPLHSTPRRLAVQHLWHHLVLQIIVPLLQGRGMQMSLSIPSFSLLQCSIMYQIQRKE